MCHCATTLAPLPQVFDADWSWLLLQPYSGEATIVPPLTLRDYLNGFTDPTPAELLRLRAAKRKPGRPRSGKTLWSVGDRVFSRVPGAGWVHGVVEGVVVGRRLTDDTVTILYLTDIGIVTLTRFDKLARRGPKKDC